MTSEEHRPASSSSQHAETSRNNSEYSNTSPSKKDMDIVNMNNGELRVISLRRTDNPKQTEILYSATLENTNGQRVFSAIIIEWQYHPGNQLSIGLGDILRPKLSYVVDLPLDVDSWRSRNEPITHRTALEPAFVIASASSMGVSSVEFNLQLHYSFVGRIDWHPQRNWDITFCVFLEDCESVRYLLISKSSWRQRDKDFTNRFFSNDEI